jgi:hypothetical protein
MVLTMGAAKATIPTRRKAEKAACTRELLASMRTPNGANRPSMMGITERLQETSELSMPTGRDLSLSELLTPSSASATEAHLFIGVIG